VNDLLKQPQLPSSPFTDLAPLLEAGQQTIKRRSLVFVISDFISAPGWERSLNLLTQRHEVMAVRLFDRREIELPDVGALLIEDARPANSSTSTPTTRRFGGGSRRRPNGARQRSATRSGEPGRRRSPVDR
jgi:hypothetical protein